VRTTFSIFLFLALSLLARGDEPRHWKAAITIQRINDPKQIDGYWSLTPEWEGYMGLALELRDGRFRYWFRSDTGPSGSGPKYPITGKFTVEHGFLVLETKQKVYDHRWLLITDKGRAGLFPFSAFETITMRRESPSTRMLFRISDAAAKAEWPRYNAPK
jgi:hypothetical protein